MSNKGLVVGAACIVSFILLVYMGSAIGQMVFCGKQYGDDIELLRECNGDNADRKLDASLQTGLSLLAGAAGVTTFGKTGKKKEEPEEVENFHNQAQG